MKRLKKKRFFAPAQGACRRQVGSAGAKNGGVNEDSVLIELPHIKGCREAWGFVEFSLGDEVSQVGGAGVGDDRLVEA